MSFGFGMAPMTSIGKPWQTKCCDTRGASQNIAGDENLDQGEEEELKVVDIDGEFLKLRDMPPLLKHAVFVKSEGDRINFYKFKKDEVKELWSAPYLRDAMAMEVELVIIGMIAKTLRL
jgi:hypothetical protein